MSSSPSAPSSSLSVYNAFDSINCSLVRNRCWLCNDTFRKGKLRKVFTLLDVLRYIHERYIGSLYMKGKGEGGDSETIPKADDDGRQEVYLCELKSTNFNNCVQRFADLEGNRDKIELDLKRFDTATWMSGLACCSNEDCSREYSYIMPNEVVAGGNAKSINVFKSADKDCPPGCNCDNPWPFLSDS